MHNFLAAFRRKGKDFPRKIQNDGSFFNGKCDKIIIRLRLEVLSRKTLSQTVHPTTQDYKWLPSNFFRKT